MSSANFAAPREPAPRPSHDWAGLLWTLVRTDFKVRYHGTAMGFLWALFKPMMMFLTLMAVFSFIFAEDRNYGLNLLIGLFLWEFFAEGTKVGLLSLQTKGYLIAKSRLPRWIVVVTAPSNALVTLTVVACTLLAALAVQGRAPSLLNAVLFFGYVACLLLIVIGFSLAASVLLLRFRDLNQVWEVITHAGFFVAPVIYPLEILPERFHQYLYVWPPTPVIQFSRSVLVAGVVPSLFAHVLLLAVTGAILATGVGVFRRYSPQIAEHL
ncbi:MAG: ABC transporter permease [Vicinamibacteria bacterium]|nr:ABC transporter permease [Vicinamibacteria bacterium]